MIFKVIGKERVSYTSKRTGKDVDGVKIHCLYTDEKRIDGNGVESLFLSGDNLKIAADILVGFEVEPFYNRFGGIERVDIYPK